MAATAEAEPVVVDDPVRNEDRYAIYTRNIDGLHRELARTSLNGIGSCILTLSNEEQITQDDPLGILDRLDRPRVHDPTAARGARP